MCIYCSTTRYRKIYENHYGPIPKDETGRSYEIHHIDGDRSNNDPNNLQCVSLQQHYDIHYSQGDYGACFKMAERMKLFPSEKSALASLAAKKRVATGTHQWLSGELQRDTQRRLVESGLHHWLSGEPQRQSNKSRLDNGSHHFLDSDWQSQNSKRRVKAGTHHFLDKEAARVRANKQLKSGNHPSQVCKVCEHCEQTVKSHIYGRWHGPNCRMHPRKL